MSVKNIFVIFRRFNGSSHSSTPKLESCIFILTALFVIFQNPILSHALTKEERGKYTIILGLRRFVPREGIEKDVLKNFQVKLTKEKKAPHIIIQLKKAPTRKEMQSLETKGIKLLSVIGGYAWYARLLDVRALDFIIPKVADSEPALSLIRWIGEISPEDKIHPFLKEKGPGSWAKTPDGRIKLSIDFFADVPRKEAKKLLSKYKAQIESERRRRVSFYIIIHPKVMEFIVKEDAVKSLEIYPPPKIKFNNGSKAWTNTDAVQRHGLAGRRVILGIWDENEVDSAHNDLGARVTFGESLRTNETSEHSTHVACTMAGDGSVNLNRRGHAPQAAEIVSYDFNGYVPGEMLQAIEDHQVAIVNNSWGYLIGWYWDDAIANWNYLDDQYLFGSYFGICSSFDDLVREDGLIMVFAIGNDRSDPTNPAVITPAQPADWDQGVGNNGYDTVAPPSTAKNVITVGAIEDATGNMARFSNWGPTDDGRIKPDIVAPGVDIWSCDDDGNNAGLGDINNQYVRMRGTSMAAPAVSGISVLLLESYRNNYLGNAFSDGVPLPSTIKAFLIHSAREMGNNPGPDFIFGWGGVDAQAAVELVENYLVIEDKITEAEEDVFRCQVPDGETEFKVTLVWDDPPGSLLLNDLDLLLRAPDGNLYYPWVLDHNNPANRATTGIDSVNNVEQVQVLNPMSGLWEVRVNGFNAKYLEQNYSLVSDFHFGPKEETFEYAAKIICGIQKESDEQRLAQGSYTTTINVHNPNDTTFSFSKKLALGYPPGFQRPGGIMPIGFDALGPDQALSFDCLDIHKRLFPEGLPKNYLEGFIVIQTPMPLDVTSVYSTANPSGDVRSIDVEQIRERDKRSPSKPPLPDLLVLPGPDGSYCRNITSELGEYPGWYKFIVTVKNQGSAYSGLFDVKFQNIQSWFTDTFYASVSGLVEDEAIDINFDVSRTTGVRYDFKITVDINGDVIESNEGNNIVNESCQ